MLRPFFVSLVVGECVDHILERVRGLVGLPQ